MPSHISNMALYNILVSFMGYEDRGSLSYDVELETYMRGSYVHGEILSSWGVSFHILH